MIVSNSRSPDKSLYLIGANLISTIKEHGFSSSPPLDLFNKYNQMHAEISFAYFCFALDWLFILGLIRLSDEGNVDLCS